MLGHQILDAFFDRRRDICRAFCHPDQDCLAFFQPGAEVLLRICRIIKSCERWLISCYHNLAQAVKSKFHVLVIQLVSDIAVVLRLPFEEF